LRQLQLNADLEQTHVKRYVRTVSKAELRLKRKTLRALKCWLKDRVVPKRQKTIAALNCYARRLTSKALRSLLQARDQAVEVAVVAQAGFERYQIRGGRQSLRDWSNYTKTRQLMRCYDKLASSQYKQTLFKAWVRAQDQQRLRDSRVSLFQGEAELRAASKAFRDFRAVIKRRVGVRARVEAWQTKRSLLVKRQCLTKWLQRFVIRGSLTKVPEQRLQQRIVHAWKMHAVQLRVRRLMKHSAGSFTSRHVKLSCHKAFSAWRTLVTNKRRANKALLKRLEAQRCRTKRDCLDLWRSYSKACYLTQLELDYQVQTNLIGEIAAVEKDLEKATSAKGVYTADLDKVKSLVLEVNQKVASTEYKISDTKLVEQNSRKRTDDIDRRLRDLAVERGALDLQIQEQRQKALYIAEQHVTVKHVLEELREDYASSSSFEEDTRTSELREFCEELENELQAKHKRLDEVIADIAKASKACRELGYKQEASEEATQLKVEAYLEEIEALAQEHAELDVESLQMSRHAYQEQRPKPQLLRSKFNESSSPHRDTLKDEIEARIKRMEHRVTELQMRDA
jgi:hypothetical protein